MASTKKSALVANHILAAIEDAHYRIGEKLPSEPELASQTRVSRNAVREALTALQILGITESRVGDGTYVVSMPQGMRLDRKGFGFREDREDLFDVWEARKEIEITIVRMAVRSSADKAIQRIHYFVQEMHDALAASNCRQYMRTSKNFHFAIAQAADNSLLEEISLPIITFTENYMLRKVPPEQLLERCKVSLKEHEEILHAIMERDQERAVLLTAKHFENASRYYNNTI